MGKPPTLTAADRKRVQQEIDLLSQINHKNIIHFIISWEDVPNKLIIFITEITTGGSLSMYPPPITPGTSKRSSTPN
jgi:hypothetical protein